MKNRFLPILFAEDLSDKTSGKSRSRATRENVMRLARALDAPIEMVHVEDFSLYPIEGFTYRSMVTELVKARKSELRRIARADPAKVRFKLLSGPVVPSLLSLAKKRGTYEMIAVGTRGRTGLGWMLLGSVAEEVLRNSPIPVLTIGTEAQKSVISLDGRDPVRVIVPTDLGENSARAEAYASKLATRLRADVVLLHCIYEDLHPVIQTAFSSPLAHAELAELFHEAKASAAARLERRAGVIERTGIRCVTVLDSRSTTAADAVLKFMRAQPRSGRPSLVVMGTHGRSRLTNAFFGKTTRKLVLRAPVPVITVRSKR